MIHIPTSQSCWSQPKSDGLEGTSRRIESTIPGAKCHKEKWTVGCKWLPESDEYEKMTNG